jgi:hypothetical protein
MVAQKRIPVTTGVNVPKFHVTDWDRLATHFGPKTFDADLKSDIERVTCSYLYLTESESAAAPIADAWCTLNELMQLAEALNKKMRLLTRHRGITRAAQDVHHLLLHNLRQHVRMPGARPLTDHVEILIGGLESFERGLKQTETELSKQENDFQLEGQAWDQWVRRLSDILKRAGLATGISKDAGDLGNQSPFVRFVCELGEQIQMQAPSYSGRETSLKGPTLAQAILRARKRTRSA